MTGETPLPTKTFMPAALAQQVAAAFAALPQVVAMAMAGSRTTDTADDQSDTDLYVYAAEPVAIADRAAVATSFATHSEVGNDFWEPGDEWIDDRTGRQVDVMYRTPAWIEEQLARVLVRHEAAVGYTTSFWSNVLHSEPLFDRSGWYRDLQEIAKRPYPEPLRRAIVAKNYPILRRTISSYLVQIERAVRRSDSVSIQHRVTALLASYFDILFAVNELPHPGEKRLLQFAMTQCAKTPPHMETQINALLETAPRPATLAVVRHVHALLDNLDALLVDEELLPTG
jgi:hypothetical protein